MSVQISWTIPYNILQDPSYTSINIYRGKDETKESGVVLEVFQKGYTYKDRVLRIAMVKVNE